MDNIKAVLDFLVGIKGSGWSFRPCADDENKHYHNQRGCCFEPYTDIDLDFCIEVSKMVDQEKYLKALCQVLGMTESYDLGYLANPINLGIIHNATIDQRIQAIADAIEGE